MLPPLPLASSSHTGFLVVEKTLPVQWTWSWMEAESWCLPAPWAASARQALQRVALCLPQWPFRFNMFFL